MEERHRRGVRSKRTSHDSAAETAILDSRVRENAPSTSTSPSPRCMRLATREQQKDSIADARSLAFTSLEDCDRSTFREYIDGKRPMAPPPVKTVERLPKRAKWESSQTETSGEESSKEDCSTNEQTRHKGKERIEVMDDALTRSGLIVLHGAPSEAIKRVVRSNLLQRARSPSSSEEEVCPGSNHGRQSRRSGRSSHASVSAFLRGPSRASLGSVGGSMGDLTRLAVPVSVSRTLSSSLSLGVSARETPPAAPDALESYEQMMRCPAPRRAQRLTTSKPSSSYHATLSMCSPSPGGASDDAH